MLRRFFRSIGGPEELDDNGIQNSGKSPLVTDGSALTFEGYDDDQTVNILDIGVMRFFFDASCAP